MLTFEENQNGVLSFLVKREKNFIFLTQKPIFEDFQTVQILGKVHAYANVNEELAMNFLKTVKKIIDENILLSVDEQKWDNPWSYSFKISNNSFEEFPVEYDFPVDSDANYRSHKRITQLYQKFESLLNFRDMQQFNITQELQTVRFLMKERIAIKRANFHLNQSENGKQKFYF